MGTTKTVLRFKACKKAGVALWPWRHLNNKQLKVLSKIAKRKHRQVLVQHRKRRPNPYFFIIQAKQLVDYMYGRLRKKYLVTLFKKSESYKGRIASTFLIFLEKRLDVTLHRVQFASTLTTARQLIAHQHVCVNGLIVSKPGYLLQSGDSVTVHPRAWHRVQRTVKGLSRKVLATQAARRAPLFNRSAHLEINYHVLKYIYLFTPQQLHYPVRMSIRHVTHAFQR
jgi:ribosomal protein S4